MAALQLRSGRPSDIPRMVSIARSARAYAMPWLPVLHSAEGDMKFFANKVLPSHVVTLALIGELVAGFMATSDGWVDHLYLDPAYHRQGIGSALLATAQAAQTNLQLWVFERNVGA